MGCMALIKAALPIRSAPANGTRGVLQLCYSLVSHFESMGRLISTSVYLRMADLILGSLFLV